MCLCTLSVRLLVMGLFVGYSMRDSNFNFIYDQVRYFSGFRTGKLNYSIVSAETTPTNEMTRSYWEMRGLEMVALRNWDSLNGFFQELSDRIGNEA